MVIIDQQDHFAIAFCSLMAILNSVSNRAIVIENESLSSISQTQYPLHFNDVKIHVYIAPKKLRSWLNLELRPARDELAMEYDLIHFLKSMYPMVLSDDPNAVDFFGVHHALIANSVGCYHTKTSFALATCNFSRSHTMTDGAQYWSNALRPFLKYIVHGMPFFNKSDGTDHFIIFTNVNGPICEPELIAGGAFFDDPFMKDTVHKMIIIGNHGTYNKYIPIGPNEADYARYSIYRQYCFDWGRDISMPQIRPSFTNVKGASEVRECVRNANCASWLELLANLATTRQLDIYFMGSHVQQLNGLWCSPNIRRFVKSFCNRRNHCGDQHLSGLFALAPAGNACWSMRFFDAVQNLAIPIILADPIVEPFEQFLDYTRFAVKIQASALVGSAGKDAYEAERRILRRVVDASSEFRAACSPQNKWSNSCMDSAVAGKLAALASVRYWLTTQAGITKLFLLELACRSKRPPSFGCNLPLSARSAMIGSFF